MPELTINGPSVPTGVHNVVLRDAWLHSPVARLAHPSDYHKVDVGVREGSYTSWVGSWTQATHDLAAGTPLSILDTDRLGMRLRADQTLVVRVTAEGTPDTLEGSRVTLRMGRVGGRDGVARPLVASGGEVKDPDSRVALRALERQINTGGLADWEEPVQLQDPVALAPTGAFHGRLERDSATAISLQRYTGNWVEIDGEAEAITSDGLSVTTSDGLLLSTGSLSATAPSSDTLYYVYVGLGKLRLSATAPSSYLGAYYLGTDELTRKWRFCGWVYLDSSTQFTDSDTAREVVNYYNRRPARLFTCPAYSDDNTAQTYAESNTSWTKVNGGTGSDVSFICNGEDIVQLSVSMVAVLDTTAILGVGLGIDGITRVPVCQERAQVGTERFNATVPHQYEQTTAGRHTGSLLSRQAAGSATIWADAARNGSSVDPAQTYLSGWVMV